MKNENLKPVARMTVFLSEDEQAAIKIAIARQRKSNINKFIRQALKSKVESMGIDFETGEVKK